MFLKPIFIIIFFLNFLSLPLHIYAQGTDTLYIDSLDTVADDSLELSLLDKEIQTLLFEMELLSNDALNHEESVTQFHYILIKNNLELLEDEIRRIKSRQDFYANYTDYILPLNLIDVKTLTSLKSLLNVTIKKYQKERFVALVLIKTLMNITFYQKDFTTFLEDYNTHKSQFAQNDIVLFIQLTEALIELQKYHAAKEIAQSLYDANPDDVIVFLNLTNALVHAKEFAELEYYTDKILVYEDVNSLIHLAIFLYSRGNLVEASSLVYFIDNWVEETLRNEYNYDINSFKWNFNNSKIPISTKSEFTGILQYHKAEDLELLATYIAALDEKLSCKFYKYAYISTFSEIELLFSADETMYMDEKQLKEYSSIIYQKKSQIQILQQTLLSRSCNSF